MTHYEQLIGAGFNQHLGANKVFQARRPLVISTSLLRGTSRVCRLLREARKFAPQAAHHAHNRTKYSLRPLVYQRPGTSSKRRRQIRGSQSVLRGARLVRRERVRPGLQGCCRRRVSRARRRFVRHHATVTSAPVCATRPPPGRLVDVTRRAGGI